MSGRVELEIAALMDSDYKSNSFVVLLKEVNGKRRLPVVIGAFEAQSIAIAVENIQPNRPLTHDLFRNVLQVLGVDLMEVEIASLNGGVFFANLVCENPKGEVLRIDARTSDALALAIRFKCPIYAMTDVMNEAAIRFDPASDLAAVNTLDASHASDTSTETLEHKTREELEEELQAALEKEDYERAASIRDELNRRE